MISVIICSARKEDLVQVSLSIEKTIGVPYEIISFDNSDGKKGICELYNAGTKQARYDLLCFMHEDIEMLSENWGSKVAGIFEENMQLGLIGIAGGGYKSVVPSSWYNADLEVNGGFYIRLMQGFRYSGQPDLYDYRNAKNEKLTRVACLDGCWLCTRKAVAEKYPFDQDLLKNFHGYDLDFSLAVNQEFQVAVTYEVLLKHFSEGNFSNTWLEDTLKVHKKWSWMLPLNIDQLAAEILKGNERRAFKVFFRRCLALGYPVSKLQQVIWHSRRSRIFPFRIILKIFFDLWKISRERRK